MVVKKFSTLLAFFFVVLLIFVAVQIINIFQKPLPGATDIKLDQVDPNLNPQVFNDLKDD